MKRKKIFFHSDFSLANTGFAKAARNTLTYLYNTGKYDIVHYCCNMSKADPTLHVTPWKSIGCMPNYQHEIDAYLNQFKPDEREPRFRAMCYGEWRIDEAIEEEKPDVYIGTQDFWGVEYATSRGWFRKINSAIWTTLDSLPLLKGAVEKAPQIKNYWLWSSFATKDLHRLGHTHAKTVHGPLNTSSFHRLPDTKRAELRAKFNISQDTFVVGFVFRNQLRKSVPNMLRGYKLFREKYPHIKARLLFHTFWGEGWNIHERADEFGVDKSEILTTYICRTCRNYEIKAFTGHDIPCKSCGDQKGQLTTNVQLGIYEDQLNEVYNLMDVYCHPFTSGGQEIPIQEAKLTELISLVTNYSCGAEMCEFPIEQSGTLSLDWAEYREPGTEFIKASTSPESICSRLEQVFLMGPEIKRNYEKISRQWVEDNYSILSVGRQIEALIDEMPEPKMNWENKKLPQNPNAQIPFVIDNFKWLQTLYRDILRMDVDEYDDGVKHWMGALKGGTRREDIENYFRNTAQQELTRVYNSDFNNLLGKDDAGKRVLYVMPESLGDVFISTALFKSIKELYPDMNLYVATKLENFEILEGNPYIYKVIPYVAQMDSLLWLEGQGEHKGYFEVAYMPFAATQRFLTYVHNAKDIVAYKDLKYASSN
jgi:glycosyltransferase involved in cell wall biosynthesis